MRAVVDLGDQHARFYASDGALLRDVPVSSGAPGTPTRVGTFVVYRKSPVTFPRTNPSVRMRWMSNFDRGIGFHAIPFRVVAGRERALPTPLGRRGVSHGCVRMSETDARWVYAHLAVGAVVVVQP